MYHLHTTSFIASCLDRLAKLPTAFHLWCAERELRVADGRTLPTVLREARARNLDLLREYRRRGEFPRNTHALTRLAPCFVDSAGRQCAVAFLMHQSGGTAAAEEVVHKANHARIAEMPFDQLGTWAAESGLSTAELARIQPEYFPTPEEIDKYVQIVLTVGIAGALAVTSILFNLIRLLWAYWPRLTTISVGVVIGIFLVGYSVLVDPWPPLEPHGFLYGELMRLYLPAAFAIGILSVACAMLAHLSRRGKWRPEPLDAKSVAASAHSGDAAIADPDEHVKAGNPSSGLSESEERIQRPKTDIRPWPTPRAKESS